MSTMASMLDSELRCAARLDEAVGALDAMLHTRDEIDASAARKRAVDVSHRAKLAIRASHLFPLVLCARELIDGGGSAESVDRALGYARAALPTVGV